MIRRAVLRAIPTVLCAATALWVGASPASAAGGAQDPTFEARGARMLGCLRERLPVGMAHQPGAGTFVLLESDTKDQQVRTACIVHILEDGRPDRAFAHTGHLRFHAPGLDMRTGRIVTGPGQVVVKWNSPNDVISLRRFTAAGAVDATFSGDGAAEFRLSRAYVRGDDVAIDAAGRILVDGSIDRSGRCCDFPSFVARITPQGALDTTFGTRGIARLASRYDSSPLSILPQPDGTTLFAERVSYCEEADISRLLPNGRPDTTFSGDGHMRLSIEDPESGCLGSLHLALDPATWPADHRVAIVYTDDSDNGYNATIDESVGHVDARTTFRIQGEQVKGIALLADGSRLVGGFDGVRRITPTGRLDRTFDRTGTGMPARLGLMAAFAADDAGHPLVLDRAIPTRAVAIWHWRHFPAQLIRLRNDASGAADIAVSPRLASRKRVLHCGHNSHHACVVRRGHGMAFVLRAAPTAAAAEPSAVSALVVATSESWNRSGIAARSWQSSGTFDVTTRRYPLPTNRRGLFRVVVFRSASANASRSRLSYLFYRVV